MKRRSFLGLLGGAVVATVVKAEPAEVTSTTPEMNFSSGLQSVRSVRIPFASYRPEGARFAVIDEKGRLGYIIQGPTV